MKINYVFSISVFAILAAGVSSGYLLHNNDKVNKSIQEEDKVLAPLPQSKAEVVPTPTITTESQLILAPKPQVKKPATPKVKVVQAAIAQAAKPCEMVCDENWQESQLGTRFKKCECK